jgi:polysaccharide chain length determinant protein (PEP-CTERM system associated)
MVFDMHKNQSEIFNYINMISRRIYAFLFVSLAVMTIITIFSYAMPKKYKADATVFIERSIIDNLVKGIAVSSNVGDRVGVLRYALLSRDMISKTLRNMDRADLDMSSVEIQDYILGLQKRTKVKVNRGNLFIVSIEDKSQAFAQEYINTLVGTYISENISSSREDSAGANMFLDDQLQILKKKLDKSERAIIDFRRKQGVYFSTDEAVDLKEIKDYLQEIDVIELNVKSIEARRERLVDQLASLSPTVNVLSHADGGGRIVALEERLRELTLRYTEDYPEIIRLRTELENAKSKVADEGRDIGAPTSMVTSVNPLYQKLQQQVFEVEAELSSLGAKKRNLQERVDRREKELRDVPETKKELGLLIQERDSYLRIYKELLGRMGQSEVSRQMESGDKMATFRIVDPAIYPVTPVSPNLVRMILLAIVAGLGCGFGAVVILENLDMTIRDSGQLEAMGVEVLAIIPRIAEGRNGAGIRRLDYLVYGVSGIYCSGFVGLLLYELMNR